MDDTCVYTAEHIQVLDGMEAVRRRPGMYIGDVQNGSGLHHMLWEVVANSLDEYLAGHASKIRVSVEGNIAEVEDDGRPTELADVTRAPVQAAYRSNHFVTRACPCSSGS